MRRKRGKRAVQMSDHPTTHILSCCFFIENTSTKMLKMQPHPSLQHHETECACSQLQPLAKVECHSAQPMTKLDQNTQPTTKLEDWEGGGPYLNIGCVQRSITFLRTLLTSRRPPWIVESHHTLWPGHNPLHPGRLTWTLKTTGW